MRGRECGVDEGRGRDGWVDALTGEGIGGGTRGEEVEWPSGRR